MTRWHSSGDLECSSPENFFPDSVSSGIRAFDFTNIESDLLIRANSKLRVREYKMLLEDKVR